MNSVKIQLLNMFNLSDGYSYPRLLENIWWKILVKIQPAILQLTELWGEMGSCSDAWYTVTGAGKLAAIKTAFLLLTLSIWRVKDTMSECVL